ncbi:MAG: hypothetical protein V8R11_02410 [Alphaproteobacteria bacterium]
MSNTAKKIVENLFDKAHRFLSEDEVIEAVLQEKLSLCEINAVIDALIKRGVYVSDDINEAINCLKKDKKITVSSKIITNLSRKIPVEPTTFEMLNIPIGSKLLFLKDKSIVAITTDNINQIKLKDGSLQGSTSGLAQILAARLGYADVARQGPRWWLYQGKTLLKIREEIESDLYG